ncbi:MAG: precorrin-8X methylmutase [Clostridia bacterium]|nr:precorrin-8X methylmutase [Clostridia bacterium]
MTKHSRRVMDIRRMNVPFTNEETQSVVAKVLARSQDEALAKSLQFSPTVISNIRRLITNGGTIITDTEILAQSIDASLLEGSPAELKCFIDDPEVLLRAQAKGTTRAEVALDVGLTQPGNKLFVIGSAPSALNRLIAHRQCEPLIDVSLLCTISGYAAAVQLKERLRESDMAFAVTRGKSGGTQAAQFLFEAILETIREKQTTL